MKRLALGIVGVGDKSADGGVKCRAWSESEGGPRTSTTTLLVGSIPTGPTHGEGRLQPHPGDVLQSTPNVRTSPRSGLNLEGRLRDPQLFTGKNDSPSPPLPSLYSLRRFNAVRRGRERWSGRACTVHTASSPPHPQLDLPYAGLARPPPPPTTRKPPATPTAVRTSAITISAATHPQRASNHRQVARSDTDTCT